MVLTIAYGRYYQSNIPFEFWDFDMKNFRGSKTLMDLYESISSDVSRAYNSGVSFCLAGLHGIGKSSVLSCFLRKCCEKNYSCLYTTLTDLVNSLIDAPRDDKYLVKKELTMVDFLVIDELDSRFVGSDATSDLFGKNLEHIIRTRGQNKLPTLFASNSPNPIEAFNGALKQSIDSLMSKVKIIPVIGKDFRKINNAQ
jgi:DNA replication protein DnaC